LIPPIVFITDSGWLLIALLVTTILLPPLVRPTALSRGLGLIFPDAKPYLLRLRPHYWLGYLIAALALAHGLAAITSGLSRGVDQLGLDFAVGALILLVAQLLIGRTLSEPWLTRRPELRRWHFRATLVLIILILGHLIFDSPTIRTILRYESQSPLVAEIFHRFISAA